MNATRDGKRCLSVTFVHDPSAVSAAIEKYFYTKLTTLIRLDEVMDPGVVVCDMNYAKEQLGRHYSKDAKRTYNGVGHMQDLD